jgi:hypothetical protein
MHLSLPFTYSITHKKSGEEKSTTSGAISRVSADIPSVRKGDVEPVADWTDVVNGKSTKKTVISWNGDLYRPLGTSIDLLMQEGTSRLSSFAREDAFKRLYGIWHWGAVRSRQLQSALLGEDTTRPIPKSRVVTSTTLDHERAEAQHMIDGIIEIEGDVWHRIPGVTLSLYQAFGREGSLSIAVGPYGHEKAEILTGMIGIQNPVLAQFFDINEEGRALSHLDANIVAERRFRDLVIHRADLVAYDGQAEFTARIMNSAVRTNEYRVGDMGDREISTWMQMRDAVSRWYDLAPQAPTEEDVQALYDFCALTPKPHMNEWPRRGCEIIDIYRADQAVTDLKSAPLQPRL